ncbi:MAG: inositol monophosphatase family protein [Chloroflexota bacterium]
MHERRGGTLRGVAGGLHLGAGRGGIIGELLGVTAPPLRLDSQAKYGLVARGDASIYLRILRGDYVECIWDHAAGSIVVEEAGGTVSDVTGAALDWDADAAWRATEDHRRACGDPRGGGGLGLEVLARQ